LTGFSLLFVGAMSPARDRSPEWTARIERESVERTEARMDISSVQNTHVLVTPAEPTDQAKQKEQRDLIQAVQALNSAATFGNDNEVTFFFDRNTHKTVIKIVNKETREVVRQIPAASVLKMAQEIIGF